MSKKSLEDQDYHVIKSAILDPDNTLLSEKQQALLERYLSAAKTLNRYPVISNAVKIHRALYPDISQALAYRDVQVARRMFNSLHSFDWDFWQNWLINDIVKQIDMARTKQDLKAWNAGHMALIKAIGNRPETVTDPKLVEKHTFIIQMNRNQKTVNVNLDKVGQIPKDVLVDLADAEYQEIDESQADEIMLT